MKNALDKSISDLLASISHDFINQLAIQNTFVPLLQNTLPTFIKGYELAVENNLISPLSQTKVIDFFKDSFVEKYRATNLTMVDFSKTIQAFGAELSFHAQNNQANSFQKCLQETILNYPFENEAQKSQIVLEEKKDFNFYISPIFITAFIQASLDKVFIHADKVSLKVSIDVTEDFNLVSLQYHGLTNPSSFQKHIFDNFFVTRNETIEPSFGFCRLALLLAGGDITCDLKEDDHLEVKMLSPIFD